MAQIRLTKAGQAVAARGRQSGKRTAIFRRDVFRMYTLWRNGEKEPVGKVLVNESEIFPEKPGLMRRAA